jgi:hypothetical protein
MSICKFKIFSGGYTPGPPLTGKGKGGEETGMEERGMGWEGEAYEMKAIGRRGGKGWDKEEGEGKGEGRTEAHPRFSPTPPV